jgi:hypothetical protein
MGLIKTAIMTGGGIYAVSKLAKTVEARQSSRSPAPSSNNEQREYGDYPADARQNSRSPNPSKNSQWREYRDYTVDPRQGGYYAGGAPPFSPPQQTRELTDANTRDYPQQEQYWYLSNDNAWTPLPPQYANVKISSHPGNPYPEQRRITPPTYPARQQLLEFDYPSAHTASEIANVSNSPKYASSRIA